MTTNTVSKFRFDGVLVLLVAAGLLVGCSNSLSPKVRDNITHQMRTQQLRFAKCYAVALDLDEDIKGTMMLDFVVDNRTGETSRMQVTSSDIPDEQFQQCVVDFARDIRVTPVPSRPVKVTYPVIFHKETI